MTYEQKLKEYVILTNMLSKQSKELVEELKVVYKDKWKNLPDIFGV